MQRLSSLVVRSVQGKLNTPRGQLCRGGGTKKISRGSSLVDAECQCPREGAPCGRGEGAAMKKTRGTGESPSSPGGRLKPMVGRVATNSPSRSLYGPEGMRSRRNRDAPNEERGQMPGAPKTITKHKKNRPLWPPPHDTRLTQCRRHSDLASSLLPENFHLTKLGGQRLVGQDW